MWVVNVHEWGGAIDVCGRSHWWRVVPLLSLVMGSSGKGLGNLLGPGGSLEGGVLTIGVLHSCSVEVGQWV
jgi:hypothetical protein